MTLTFPFQKTKVKEVNDLTLTFFSMTRLDFIVYKSVRIVKNFGNSQVKSSKRQSHDLTLLIFMNLKIPRLYDYYGF